eukprot:m.298924 g.298924  ORF g.298924 m.298924 type:complete len:737 (+) comp19541_c1_seq9:127-2337(+)
MAYSGGGVWQTSAFGGGGSSGSDGGNGGGGGGQGGGGGLGLGVGALPSAGSAGGLTRESLLQGGEHTPPSQITVNGPLSAVSASPDRTCAVVAGRDVLKVITFDGDTQTLTEKVNLRVGRRSKGLDFCNIDVSWHPMESCSHLLATAASNGAIVLWDLNRTFEQKIHRVITSHNRTTNCVRFHNSDPNLLLSGSQDKSVRRFDLRTLDSGPVTIFQPKEGVRQVAINPHNPHQFAAALENGNIQLWDMRTDKSCDTRIQAHQGPAYCLDWHPDIRNRLASGGRDLMVYVWDVQAEKRLQCRIQTIASVASLKWRPSHPSHIGSCSLAYDFAIHVWDTNRPHVPFVSFCEHKNSTTGFEWGNEGRNVVLSCSKDCRLIRQTFRHARNGQHYAECRSMGAIFSPSGSLATFRREQKTLELPPGSVEAPSPTAFERGNNLLSLFSPKKIHTATVAPSVVQSAMTVIPLSVTDKFNQVFVHLAKNFLLSGKRVPELCDHNAAVARDVGEFDKSQTWVLLRFLWCPIHEAIRPPGCCSNPIQEESVADTAEDRDVGEGLVTAHPIFLDGRSGGDEDELDVVVDVGNAFLPELREEAFEPRVPLSSSSSEGEDELGDYGELDHQARLIGTHETAPSFCLRSPLALFIHQGVLPPALTPPTQRSFVGSWCTDARDGGWRGWHRRKASSSTRSPCLGPAANDFGNATLLRPARRRPNVLLAVAGVWRSMWDRRTNSKSLVRGVL